jgi:hypothetical protein
MFRLVIVSLIAACFSMAREIPSALAEGISEETAALTLIPADKWAEVGFRGVTKRLTDAVIDDSGNVHLAVDKYFRGRRHVWHYLCFDKMGRKLFETEIYDGEYITYSHNLLVSRILVNPDMTTLFLYPDSDFYTCWAKVDKEGRVIERNEPRWWRGDANFRVCVIGQDSFHIATFPVSFWSQLIRQYDSVYGEHYLRVDEVLIASVYYSNSFALREQRVPLRHPYLSVNVPRLIPISDTMVFAFSYNHTCCVAWFIDYRGNCYSAEGFDNEELDEICFAKVSIDSILDRLRVDIPPFPDWVDLSSVHDNMIDVGIYWNKTIYMVRYNINGKVIQADNGKGDLRELDSLDHENTSAFIRQVIYEGSRGTAIPKTIFYWGFDDKGNFFLQNY